MEDDSGDDFVASKLAPKRPATKVFNTPPTTGVDDAVSVLEKLSIAPAAAIKISKPAEAKGTAVNTAATKPVVVKKAPPTKAPAKKAPPKKKTISKKAAKMYDSSDEDSDGFEGDSSDSEVEVVSAPLPGRERSGRAAAKKVTYVIDDSDDDLSDEECDF